MDETVSRFSRLDILVNNVGVGHFAQIESFPLTEFDRMVTINLRGTFAAMQRAVPHLEYGARIITIGSIQADKSPFPGLSVYAMTKAALAGLSRALARELGPRGITVNVIQPGAIATDANPESAESAEAIRNLAAVGRYGRPEEIASAVSYLAGPEAAYVTGATWNIDGGVV